MRFRIVCVILLALVPISGRSHAVAAEQTPDAPSADKASELHLTPAELFAVADAARDRGDYAFAERAFRALATNPDVDLRSEARFRLALMLADRQHHYREAAMELRHILDEKPNAGRVRLELARIDALLGYVNEAGRELRAAQAGGLPPEVERAVRFYAQAIDTQRRVGGSIEIALAPDSNVNRATRSGTLTTVIGDFTLSQDAQAQPGVGVAMRGQSFVRLPLLASMNLLARLSGSASIYRSGKFDDFILAPQIGPELTWGRNKAGLAVGPAWRWYGGRPYTASLVATADWQRVLGARGQVRANGTYAHIRNRRNPSESGDAVTIAVGLDQAFSSRFGGGVQLSSSRQLANVPAYATTAGGIGGYLFRELHRTTVAVDVRYSHLEADRRLSLFADRRVDDDFAANISCTFRQVQIGAVSPLVRIRYEHNGSRVQLYQYRRLAGELGIATAF